MLKEHKKSWVDVLPFVKLAINSMMSDSTGHTPFFVCYGQEVARPIDILGGVSSNPAAQDYVNHMSLVYDAVRTRLHKA